MYYFLLFVNIKRNKSFLFFYLLIFPIFFSTVNIGKNSEFEVFIYFSVIHIYTFTYLGPPRPPFTHNPIILLTYLS